MITLALTDVDQPADSKHPGVGKSAVERRRRPLTAFCSCILCLLILTTASRWPNHGMMRESLFLLGISLAAVGMLGRVWSNLFVSGYKTKELVRSGPYSLCRNPLYLFSAIGMVGVGLCTGTLAIPVLMAVFFAIYYPMIIEREEQRLGMLHPDAFENYCVTTPAFWPRFDGYHDPETYMMYPRIMRKHLADAFWFVALAAIVHVISRLHSADVLPDFFSVW